MRAPAFWWRPAEAPGWEPRLLAPAAWAWGIGAAIRSRGMAERVAAPVVCVGNLTAGGTGKTPLVAALAERLTAAGHAPQVLSRGHGGRLGRDAPHRVDPARDSAADVGDEPLLLAALAPVWVARDRAAGGRAAAAAGARPILMDDGFQNPRLAKDLSILVVDAARGFGNARLIPAGPLREPVAGGLARADIVVAVGGDPAPLLARWPRLAERPLVTARIVPRKTGLEIAGLPVIAFAGIGEPAKFFATLRAMGGELVEAHPFPDHHVYDPRVVERLIRRARTLGTLLVTTEKDAIRLPPALRREVMTLPVVLEIADWGPIDAGLARIL